MLYRILWKANVAAGMVPPSWMMVIISDTLSQTKNFDINPKRPLIIFDFGY
jgi:hypothetical protein